MIGMGRNECTVIGWGTLATLLPPESWWSLATLVAVPKPAPLQLLLSILQFSYNKHPVPQRKRTSLRSILVSASVIAPAAIHRVCAVMLVNKTSHFRSFESPEFVLECQHEASPTPAHPSPFLFLHRSQQCP